jgi:hypothetical protein
MPRCSVRANQQHRTTSAWLGLTFIRAKRRVRDDRFRIRRRVGALATR